MEGKTPLRLGREEQALPTSVPTLLLVAGDIAGVQLAILQASRQRVQATGHSALWFGAVS